MFEVVNEGKTISKDFFQSACNIYEGDINWVCVPDSQIIEIFNLETNPLLKDGNYNVWVLYQENKPVGRLIAFWTEKKSKKKKPFFGGISFFECIDSQVAANMLFNNAKQWLKLEGMQVMDAVIMPGENYNHWGILIDGFEQQGFGMPYNKPYYKELFEEYGFKTYFEQNSYHVDLSKDFPERIINYAKHVANKEEFTFDHVHNKNINKYISDTTKVYNDVWSYFHAEHQFVEESYFDKIVKQLKPISNEKFLWFAYKDNYPVGMAIALPDLNKVIKPFKGKLDLFKKIKLVRRIKKVDRARLLVYGIHPDYHSSGLAAALFWKMSEAMKEEGIKELEMSWVGDYNPKVNRIYKHMGNSKHAKTHATMRYVIDEDVIFERFAN